MQKQKKPLSSDTVKFKTNTSEVSGEIKVQLARALADYDNLVKRQNRERQEIRLRANRIILEDLVGVLDDLEKAEKYLSDPGLKMGMDNLRTLLVKYGVCEIDTKVGVEFNSNLHEAVDAIDGGQKNSIAEIFVKGYKWIDGQVLRPAKVIVYKGE